MPLDADFTIANAQLRLTMSAMLEVLSENSFNEITNQAGMQYRNSVLPEDNFASSVSAVEYAKLMEAVERTYSRSGGRILERIGKAYFQLLLREQPAMFNLARTALGFWSEDQRARFVLESLVDMLNRLNPQMDLRLEEEFKKWTLIDYNCCFCHQRTSQASVCHFMVGLIKQAVEWARVKDVEVCETSCTAKGDNSCRYLISRS
jgi:predicted hydrocarbon binding protein